jgi:hypothetical protein
MSRISLFHIKLIVLCALCIPFLGCEPKEDSTPENPRMIAPSYKNEETAVVFDGETGDEYIIAHQDVKVPMFPEDSLLNILDGNIDDDEFEEQIVIYKKHDDPADKIHILVVDFDTVRGSFVPAWEAVTGATNVRSFYLYLDDLIGDNNPEIICLGMNNEGNQSLDIYRRNMGGTGIILSFYPILSLDVQGTIEIEELKRSELYSLEKQKGESFPVVTFSEDPVSENSLDLIKKTYLWKFQDNRYIEVREEKIEGVEIEEKQLTELFEGGEELFEEFLDGPWGKVTGINTELSSPIIYFDNSERTIVFYSGVVQEVFTWKSSHRTIYKGLYINTANELIPTIAKPVSISVVNLDTIRIHIKGSESWDGSYIKMSEAQQKEYYTRRETAVHLSEIGLAGLFKNENKVEIYFDRPYFTMREDGLELSGGYSVFSIGEDILELKILEENGLTREMRTYKIDLEEVVQEESTIRTLVLTPVTLNIGGIIEEGVSIIQLQQIIQDQSE